MSEVTLSLAGLAACSDTSPLQGLRSVDIAKFSPLGEKFDPNMHNGAFEMPAGEAGKGMVGAVIKSGAHPHMAVTHDSWLLHHTRLSVVTL